MILCTFAAEEAPHAHVGACSVSLVGKIQSAEWGKMDWSLYDHDYTPNGYFTKKSSLFHGFVWKLLLKTIYLQTKSVILYKKSPKNGV